MRGAKVWTFQAILMALAGAGMFLATSSTSAQPGPGAERREERREERNYWRHHDGRWSHWDARDKRWYYTDGQHWFYHNGTAWQPYRFDRAFGREFERGGYRLPGEGTTIVVPSHTVYVP